MKTKASHQPDIAEVYADLIRATEALGDYRSAIVLAGGLVPLCYRQVFGVGSDLHSPLLTFDIDWAVPNEVPLKQGRSIRQAIEMAGFREILSQFVVPPVAKFQHERFGDEEPAPVYLDFITDRSGGPTSRLGADRSKLDVQAGFKVIALPYVRLLFEKTMEFDLSTIESLHLDNPLAVRIPHPACYVLHKILVSQKRRKAEKRDKDLAYLYDLAVGSRDDWITIQEAMAEIRQAKRFPASWWQAAQKIVAKVFGETASSGPIGVARIYSSIGESVSEPSVLRVMTSFFKEIGLV